MTVEELLDALRNVPFKHFDKTVYLSRDAEGNGFEPVTEVEIGLFDGEDFYNPDDAPENCGVAIVLWP